MNIKESIYNALHSTSEELSNYKLAQQFSYEKSNYYAEDIIIDPFDNLESTINIISKFDNNKNIKFLYFIRHGEGIHNVIEAKYGRELWEEKLALLDKYLDPSLTELGINQAIDLKNKLLKTWLSNKNLPQPELIISSPLKRCILTANYIFNPPNYKIPRIICELFRERNGRHTCDKRNTLKYINNTFPHWNLNHYYNQEQIDNEDNDPLWSEKRETIIELNNRAHNFLNWLWYNIDQKHIILSGHSGIIGACFANLGKYQKLKNCQLALVIINQKNNITKSKSSL